MLATNLGAAITRRGGRVLLVELDPQGTATYQVTGLLPQELKHTVGSALVAYLEGDDARGAVEAALLRTTDPDLPMSDYARQTWGTLDILPANTGCAGLQLASHQLRSLAGLLDSIAGDYDLVLYDSAPSISNLTLTGMYAAQRAISVTHPVLGSINGVRQLVQEFITPVQRYHPDLEFAGAVINRVDVRKSEHRRRVDELLEQLGGYTNKGGKACPALIPDRTIVEQAEGARLPIWAMAGPDAATIADLVDKVYRYLIYQKPRA